MTNIEWTERTWNPVRGCSRVSPGCDSCYAMGQAHRFSGPGKPYDGLTTLRRGKVDWSGVARFVPEMLSAPLRVRKPTTWFVNSMSDLFHHSVTDEQIDMVFGVMWACMYIGRDAQPGHVFQVLTKRADRMRSYMATDRREAWATAAVHYGGGYDPDGIHDQVRFHKGPHPRIWLGVSAEDQQRADERIPHLLATPAAVRFVSAEPLLGPIELPRHDQSMWPSFSPLDWVIVGGESGPGARPCDVAWIRSIVEQCRTAGVACFVKQLGARPEERPAIDRAAFFGSEASSRGLVAGHIYGGAQVTMHVGWRHLKDKKGGDPTEWPDDLRVRQFPEVRP